MPTINELPQGGVDVLTELWTNTAPSSNFATQTITLSETPANFTRICIEYKRQKSDADSVKQYYDTADFDLTNTDRDYIFFGAHDSTNNRSYVRRLHINNTNITFSDAYRLNNSGTSNGYAVPVKFYGIK